MIRGPAAIPLTAHEFAALMAPLGPWDATRRVAAAVSGGPDSLALALLLRTWGAPLALVVDHGLRPSSAAEAALTLRRLAALGIPARLLPLRLQPGPDLGARARHARYHALLEACRTEGCPDLLLGHHAEDQAETIVLRTRAGSAAPGRAGMAAVAWRGPARLVRPLLSIDPARLRATLAAAGVGWVEDPTNTDPATARGSLRATGYERPDPVPAAHARAATDARLATELARHVTLYPTGHAEVAAPLTPEAWSALIWTLSGRAYPPPAEAAARLAARGAGTLNGIMVRRGLAVREAPAAPIPAHASALWDGRFRLGTTVEHATIGALGADAAVFRRRPGLPFDVLRTLPAVRLGGKLFIIPHLGFPDAETCRSVPLCFRPTRPLAGVPFRPA